MIALFYFLGYGQDVSLPLAGEDYSIPGDNQVPFLLLQETERMYLSLSQENIIQFQVVIKNMLKKFIFIPKMVLMICFFNLFFSIFRQHPAPRSPTGRC